MKYDYHIIVIGAGSAGLVVAAGAASLGAKVALIEANKMGGECLNTGCIPSKSLLKGAHLLQQLKDAEALGLSSTIKDFQFPRLMAHVNQVIQDIAPHDSIERFTALGVHVIQGRGRFQDRHHIRVNDRLISGRKIVIATGSSPRIPDIKGLDNVYYYTNENLFEIKKQPKHLIVLGGGPMGCELGQGFLHLGSHVTLVDRHDSILRKNGAEASELMKSHFLDEGMVLKLENEAVAVNQHNNTLHVSLSDGSVIKGDVLLIALGRKANTQSLGLDQLDITLTERGFIQTNQRLQTNIRNIYACGDVTGPYLFTHMASYQAELILKHAIFKLPVKATTHAIPWITFTQPEIAHVGMTEQQAKKQKCFSKAIKVSLSDIDRAKCDHTTAGFLKLIVNKRSKIIGVTLVGPTAGEQLAFATLLVKHKRSVSDLLSIIYAYPTQSEIFKLAALQAMKAQFKPWHQKVIKHTFLR